MHLHLLVLRALENAGTGYGERARATRIGPPGRKDHSIHWHPRRWRTVMLLTAIDAHLFS